MTPTLELKPHFSWMHASQQQLPLWGAWERLKLGPVTLVNFCDKAAKMFLNAIHKCTSGQNSHCMSHYQLLFINQVYQSLMKTNSMNGNRTKQFLRGQFFSSNQSFQSSLVHFFTGQIKLFVCATLGYLCYWVKREALQLVSWMSTSVYKRDICFADYQMLTVWLAMECWPFLTPTESASSTRVPCITINS